jgi:hypothetical protein
MSEQINNGKMEVMGINIDISQVLGQKIVDQYIAQLTEENIKTIMDYISADLFSEISVYNYDIGEMVKKLVIKERAKDNWGNYKGNEIPIGELIKRHFNNRINEELKAKVEEIIESTDYKQKVEDIANELVDYSINGYKEDMKARIRQRLVNNVIDNEPYYYGMNLRDLINREIDNRLNY